MSLTPGRQLSHYRLVEPIGEGGMGIVWRATDLDLGRDVAIKVLPPVFADDPERMARFEREARLLASLSHSGIAGIFGVGSADGVRFLAMELVEGDDLAERISRGPVPIVESLELTSQIAAALEVAHEKGIIHRDLKPANVKATPEGQVKLLDFGLAKALDSDPGVSNASHLSHSPTITSPMTAANVILGTAAYMSPEQARGKAVDRRADIWAFGCVLFECLTGQRAFAGETVSDTLAKILEREPDLAQLPAGTPHRVRELIQRCLVKDAKLRLRDIGDARIVLQEVLATRSASGRLPVVESAPATPAARSRSLLLIAGTVLIGALLGAGVWSMLGPGAAGTSRAVPRALSVAMPANLQIRGTGITRDGNAVVALAQPIGADGTVSPDARLYARTPDSYDFKEIPGTTGAVAFIPEANSRTVLYLAPVATGASQLRLWRIPVDGSAPAVAVVDWQDSWNLITSLDNDDLLISIAQSSFVRIARGASTPSAPVKMDAARSGVSRYEFAGTIPGGTHLFVNVVLYDARGWHLSVGVLDLKSGKVKVVEDDGGNAKYSPTGHMVFSRGNTVLAVPFDRSRLEPHGTPVAVWSGLAAGDTYTPGPFSLTNDGTLFYVPGQLGAARPIVWLDAAGRTTPWSATPRTMDFMPALSHDGRRLALQFINARGIDELWVTSADHDDLQRVPLESKADAFFATWSPDGRKLAYRRSGKDGKDGVYVIDIESGEMRCILPFKSDSESYDANSWAPDGSGLTLTRNAHGAVSVAFLPVNGDQWGAPQPVALGEGRRSLPLVSPDGRALAFQSDESGKTQSYVIGFHAGQVIGRAVPVPTSGGYWHQWSSDGSALVVQDEHNRLQKVAVSTAPAVTVGAAKEIADLDKSNGYFWAVLPGDRVFVGQKNANELNLTRVNVVLNWTTLLQQKSAK